MLGAMSLVGAGVKAAGSIYGGIKASKAIREQRRNIENQLRENQDWYDQRYNEDATQRADAQRLLTMTEDSIRNRNAQAAGAQAVMGGTDESVAAAREANNDALAQSMSNINAAAEARKSNIEQQYMNTKQNLNQQLNALSGQQAQEIQKAVGGVSDAVAGLAGTPGSKDNKDNG